MDRITHRIADQCNQVEGNLAKLLFCGRNAGFLSSAQTIILVDEFSNAFTTEWLLVI